jgi:hypothetical protein
MLRKIKCGKQGLCVSPVLKNHYDRYEIFLLLILFKPNKVMYNKLFSIMGMIMCLACGPSKPKTQEFTIKYFNDPELPAVNITAGIPSSWDFKLSPQGEPNFEIPNASNSISTITVVAIDEDDPNERLTKALNLQFDKNDSLSLNKTPYDDGRLWVYQINESGHLHARMFLPVPNGYAMAVAMLSKEKAESAKLGPAELKAIFETVQVKK